MAIQIEGSPVYAGHPHGREYGDLLFLSGMGPEDNEGNIPGGPMRDSNRKSLQYDIYRQTHATIQNIKRVIENNGGCMDDLVDVQCFLVDMKRDFKDFNKAYREGFQGYAPTRTTVSVRELPTGAGINIKVIARKPNSIIKVSDVKTVRANSAPKPVGAYPHAKRFGDLLFISGMGPRDPQTNTVPGGPIYDSNGNPSEYDVAAQTRSTINNIRLVLEACGAKFEDIIDCNCFLVDMARDFKSFNQAYKEEFGGVAPTRTTFSIRALPTPIAVELKVIVRAPESRITATNAAIVHTEGAPKPVGAYPHARRFGQYLFISGMGPRDPSTNQVPGGPIYDQNRKPLPYDVAAQTQATINNISTVLESCGTDLSAVVDIQNYLVNMPRDFEKFSVVYEKNFGGKFKPAATTMAVRNLPTPIAVEMKCIAMAPKQSKL